MKRMSDALHVVGERCCVVVPCYNEGQRLHPEAFISFAAEMQGIVFVFVNDGSTDNTLSVLQYLTKQLGSAASVLDLERNCGKAEAVRRGLLHAINDLNAHAIGFWDADLATPLSAIPELLNHLNVESTQMVFGARVKLLGRNIQRKANRHYLGRVFATAVSVLLKVPVYDTQCGAKLFRVTPVLIRILKQPFHSRWIFDVEILARYTYFNKSGPGLCDCVYEYPLTTWTDVAGSKVRPKDFIQAFVDLIGIYRRYL